MPSLREAQAAMREAIVAGDSGAVLPLLTGEGDLRYRLSIHQRHYAASLADVLRRRFPVLGWLVGEGFLNQAASQFAKSQPPERPALGEYGQYFPAFLAGLRGTEEMPWLAEVGALEWRLGEAAAAVDAPALPLDAFLAFADTPLEEIGLTLQPGLRYLAADWPVDDLVRLHLEKSAPEELRFAPMQVFLEVRGSRGAFAMRRLDPETFAFRRELAAGRPLAFALMEAGAEAGFDAGKALAELFGEGLVAAVTSPGRTP